MNFNVLLASFLFKNNAIMNFYGQIRGWNESGKVNSHARQLLRSLSAFYRYLNNNFLPKSDWLFCCFYTKKQTKRPEFICLFNRMRCQ